MNSVVPVITGVPPRPSADFTHGRRYFVNGATDRAGLKRRLPSADDSDDEAPVDNKKLVATEVDSDHEEDEEDDKADEENEEEVEPHAKAVKKRATSPRRTRSKTDPAQPGRSKAVDRAKVANIAKAAGITFRTVAVEIPETPITRKCGQRLDDITLSSGTGSRYSPSRSPTPGPSKKRGTQKRTADDLRCESEGTESLSDVLAAAATIAKGKQRAEDVGMRAFQSSDNERESTNGDVRTFPWCMDLH